MSKIINFAAILVFTIICVGLLYLLYEAYFYNDDVRYNDYYKKPIEEFIVYESNNDYSMLAEKITQNTNCDYDKIMAIYLWLCDNIEYDTSYKIHRADSCFTYSKGVCIAYCELFYHMAKSIGVKSEIVLGYTRDKHGVINNNGHAWVFAYTRRNHGILIDPTWGAGWIDESGIFHKRDNPLHWFNVDPRWMILSHYPKEKQYQLLDEEISFELFKQFPILDEIYLDYGLGVTDVYESAVSQEKISLPKFYNSAVGDIEIIDLPRKEFLSIGEFYNFTIKIVDTTNHIAIINDKLFVETEKWDSVGNNTYSIRFMPTYEGLVRLGIKNQKDNSWKVVLEYNVGTPNENNWKKVEQHYPLCIPEVRRIKNLNRENWELFGVSSHELLNIIRSEKIKELPYTYIAKGQKLQIKSIPMNLVLDANHLYSFCFYPKSGIKWAIVNNNKWFNQWKIDSTNLHMMQMEPEKGNLGLYVQFEEGGVYWPVVKYNVD